MDRLTKALSGSGFILESGSKMWVVESHDLPYMVFRVRPCLRARLILLGWVSIHE